MFLAVPGPSISAQNGQIKKKNAFLYIYFNSLTDILSPFAIFHLAFRENVVKVWKSR